MSYRAELIGNALLQFHELQRVPDARDALMNRIVRLIEDPWDAWLVAPVVGLLAYRETTFGAAGNGLISFYADDDAEIIYIFNLVWVG